MIPYSRWTVCDELLYLDNIGRSAKLTKEMSKEELLNNYLVGLSKMSRKSELSKSIPELRTKVHTMLKQIKYSKAYQRKLDGLKESEKTAC